MRKNIEYSCCNIYRDLDILTHPNLFKCRQKISLKIILENNNKCISVWFNYMHLFLDFFLMSYLCPLILVTKAAFLFGVVADKYIL